MASEAKIWGGFTAEELEWQYNPRLTMADFAGDFAAIQALSAPVRESLTHQADIRFGDGPKETFDLYPAGPDAPVHVFFHGGYWRATDKQDYAFIARDLVARGISVILANYDLCPDVTVAEINRQCRRCIDFIRAHGADLGVDITRLSISGHSAGGQMVARLAAADWGGEMPFRAVVPVSGVFDVTPLCGTTINEALGHDQDAAEAVSPILEPPVPAELPVMLVVGGEESPEFKRQSAAYAAHLEAGHGKLPVHLATGANHMTVLPALYSEGGELFEAFTRFISR